MMSQLAVKQSPMVRWQSQSYTVAVVQRKFGACFWDSFYETPFYINYTDVQRN